MNDLAARSGLLLLILAAACVVAQGQPAQGSAFLDFVSRRVESASSKHKFDTFCPVDESRFARKIFLEYGAMFVAGRDIELPSSCYFPDEAAVVRFQSTLKTSSTTLDGVEIKLQAPAMASLLKVLDAARQLDVSISPLDGSIAAARSYPDSLNIWNSRFQPALAFWARRAKISQDDVDHMASMPLPKKVEKVMDWEASGLLFGTGRQGSIFSSTAPPGTSQHLSLIAFDVAGAVTPLITALFNANGWFQTIKGDPDHFTYLGVLEGELPKRGLKQIYYHGYRYWVPDLPAASETNLQD